MKTLRIPEVVFPQADNTVQEASKARIRTSQSPINKSTSSKIFPAEIFQDKISSYKNRMNAMNVNLFLTIKISNSLLTLFMKHHKKQMKH